MKVNINPKDEATHCFKVDMDTVKSFSIHKRTIKNSLARYGGSDFSYNISQMADINPNR